jgi:four helix bundle protein
MATAMNLRSMRQIWPGTATRISLASDHGAYRELTAWQRGMELVRVVYELTKYPGRTDDDGFCERLRAQALSIPTAIAQGQSAGGTAHFSYMLSQVKCTMAAMDTQVILAMQLQLISHEAKCKIETLLTELHYLIEQLSGKLTEYKSD